MPGEIKINYELIPKDIVALEKDSETWGEYQHVCVKQDGEIVMEGGKDICTSTTHSYVIMLKHEAK